MRRARENETTKTTSELLDELNNAKDQDQFNDIYTELAGHPFFNGIMDRLAALEIKAALFDKHEHKDNGDIVLRA